jgi:hypothetical protein
MGRDIRPMESFLGLANLFIAQAIHSTQDQVAFVVQRNGSAITHKFVMDADAYAALIDMLHASEKVHQS